MVSMFLLRVPHFKKTTHLSLKIDPLPKMKRTFPFELLNLNVAIT